MTLTVQFYTIVSMMLMGIWIGAAVDTYGRFMHPGRWSILLFLSDILFWIVHGLLVFFVLLIVNEGEIRIYIFVALLCGYAMYRALFQTLYQRLLNVWIRFSRAVIRFVVQTVQLTIVKPLQTIIQLLIQALLFFGSLLLGFLLFILRSFASLLKGFGRLIWAFIPESLRKSLKKLAGFVKIVQNKIKKWFGRD